MDIKLSVSRTKHQK